MGIWPPHRPEEQAAERDRRRRSRVLQELWLRVTVALLVLFFDEIFNFVTGAGPNRIVRVAALAGLGLNGPYYLAFRTGRALRAQGYVRMLVDIVLITAGMYSVGGLAASPYLSLYMLVPLYVGLVFSGEACLVATAAATACYLAMAGMEQAGWLPAVPARIPSGWGVAVFNLLMLNLAGGLTAVLAEAYRRSRQRLAEVNVELERAHDQSLLLNAEIQRSAQLRMLGEVVAGLAHELGNVLTAAAGHVVLARRRTALPAEADRHLAHIEDSVQTAMRIVRSALDTARRPAEGRTTVSVAEVAHRVVDLKAYDLRRDGIRVHLDFPELPFVLGVPFQLQQVLLNLVTNAQQALRSAPGPRVIELAGGLAGTRVLVEVRDTGPGIPDAVRSRLFEPFFTTKSEGTGLGLAISAGIVSEHGGELTGDNRPEGGAVFRFSLPGVVGTARGDRTPAVSPAGEDPVRR